MVENEYQSAESLCQDEAKLKIYTGNYYFVSIHKILTVYQIFLLSGAFSMPC